MKRRGLSIVILILAALWVIGITGCQKKSEKVVEDIGESSRFTEEERRDAIKCVRDNFHFEGATLEKIWYDENETSAVATSKDMNKENTIVLLSQFYVDKSGKNPVLSPNTTYKSYSWILVRKSKSDEWKIIDQGY